MLSYSFILFATALLLSHMQTHVCSHVAFKLFVTTLLLSHMRMNVSSHIAFALFASPSDNMHAITNRQMYSYTGTRTLHICTCIHDLNTSKYCFCLPLLSCLQIDHNGVVKLCDFGLARVSSWIYMCISTTVPSLLCLCLCVCVCAGVPFQDCAFIVVSAYVCVCMCISRTVPSLLCAHIRVHFHDGAS